MPDQDFTLSLKMTADGASAVQESARLADNLERAVAAAERLRNVQPASAGGSSSPSSGSDSAPTPKIALLASVMRTFAAETDRAVSGVQSLTGAVTAFGERAATVQGAIGQAAQTTQDNTQAQTRNAEAQRQSAQATETNARAAKASSAGILSRIGAVFGAVGKGVSTAFGVLKGAFSGIMSVIKGVASFVAAPFKLAWKGITTVFKTLLGVLGSVAAAGYGAAKILSPAGEVQRYEVQTGVMLKNPAMGKRRVAELNRYAKETNYSPAEVIGAGTQLQAFGMYSMRTLRIAGDVANVFGKKLEEVIQPLAYLKAGRTGEAFQSLSRFGVSREALKPYGVKFKKNGELETSNKKALQAVLQYFEREYNGVTERVGRTWKGTLQQLGGEVFDAMAKGFRGALEPATAYVRSHLIPTITSIGQALASLDWNRILATPMRILSGVTDIFAQLSNPQMRELGKQNLSDLWDGLKAVGWALLETAGHLAAGFVRDVIDAFGGLGGILKTAWDGLQTIFSTAIAGLASILESTSNGFLHNAGVLIDKAFGGKFGISTGELDKEETVRRNAASKVSTALENLSGNNTQRKLGEKTLRSLGWSDEQISAAKRQDDEDFQILGKLSEERFRKIGQSRSSREHLRIQEDYEKNEAEILKGIEARHARYANSYANEQARQVFGGPADISGLWKKAAEDRGRLFDDFSKAYGNFTPKHTLEHWDDDKAGLALAVENVVKPASHASAQTSLFRQGGQGRAFVGAMDWAMAHGSTPEQATQAAREWTLIQGAEQQRRREAFERHRAFRRNNPEAEDREWNDFNSTRSRKIRANQDRDMRAEWMNTYGGEARNEQEIRRQNQATRELTNRLDKTNILIADLRKYLAPIVNSYKNYDGHAITNAFV